MCAPAAGLLAGGSTLPLERALRLCTADIGWDEALADARLRRAAAISGRTIARLAQLNPAAATTLRALLDVVAAGRGPELVQPFLRGDIPARLRQEATAQALCTALEDVALHLLAARQRIRVGAAWHGEGVEVAGIEVLSPDGHWTSWPAQAFRAAATAADPYTAADTVQRLTTELADLGAQLEHPLAASGDDSQPRSIPAAALTVALPRPRYREQRRDQAYDLIAFDDGLLLVHVPGPDRGIAAGLRHRFGAGNQRQLSRVQRTLQQVDGRPAQFAEAAGNAARWIPYTLVDTAFWQQNRLSTTWRLTLHDATSVDFALTAFSEPVGNLQETVASAIY